MVGARVEFPVSLQKTASNVTHQLRWRGLAAGGADWPLVYRGLAILSGRPGWSNDLPVANRRHGRLQICATPSTSSSRSIWATCPQAASILLVLDFFAFDYDYEEEDEDDEAGGEISARWVAIHSATSR
jgi:hypothetical protein